MGRIPKSNGVSIEDALMAGPILYDRKKAAPLHHVGRRTKMGWYEYLYEAFHFIELRPENRMTQATLLDRICTEFSAYPALITPLRRIGGMTRITRFRYLYNQGWLPSPEFRRPPPKRISLRWGIPLLGETGEAMRQWLKDNPGQHPVLVAINVSSEKHEVTDDDIRSRCLWFEIKDDRYFTKKECTDAVFTKLRKEWEKTEKGQIQLRKAETARKMAEANIGRKIDRKKKKSKGVGKGNGTREDPNALPAGDEHLLESACVDEENE